VPGAYICFALGVILVGALTLIEVPCPIDKGTGVITGAKGLKITGVEAELVDFFQSELGCGEEWVVFTYVVNISVVNETTTPIYGGIVLTFYDPETAFIGPFETENPIYFEAENPIYMDEGADIPVVAGAVEYVGEQIVRIPILVEIPAETAETIEENIVFEVFNDLRDVHELYGKPHSIYVKTAEAMVCPYSGGTGKVPITEWLRIKTKVQWN
jgi:hypothetical protein